MTQISVMYAWRCRAFGVLLKDEEIRETPTMNAWYVLNLPGHFISLYRSFTSV